MPRGAAASALTGGVLASLLAQPAQAAVLEDYEITGVQFVNDDCSRNEYAVTTTITGDTDDGAGFDRFRVQVWDDGTLQSAVDADYGEDVVIVRSALR